MAARNVPLAPFIQQHQPDNFADWCERACVGDILVVKNLHVTCDVLKRVFQSNTDPHLQTLFPDTSKYAYDGARSTCLLFMAGHHKLARQQFSQVLMMLMSNTKH